MNKQEKINIRVTKEEKDIVLSKAKLNNMKLSDYVRHVALHSNKVKVEIQ